MNKVILFLSLNFFFCNNRIFLKNRMLKNLDS